MIDGYDKKFINEMAIGILDELKELSTTFADKFSSSMGELDESVEYLAIQVQELKEEIRSQTTFCGHARNSR